MPCRDGGDCEPAASSAPEWMLCEAMTILTNQELLGECSVQLQEWWHAHQGKEADRVRAEATGKLNARERLALGIDNKGQYTKTRIIKAKR